jgi:hypothetical protein
LGHLLRPPLAPEHERARALRPRRRPGRRRGAVPFIKPGTKSDAAYNHYSLLKTVEMIFGLPPLGDARQPQVHAFGAGVFTG